MKNSFASKLIYFFTFLFLTANCVEKLEDDPIPTIEGTDWVKVSDTGNSIYSSSYLNENLNLISGDKLFYSYNLKGDNNNVFDFSEFQSRPGWFKLPVTQDFLVTRKELEVNIFGINSNSISQPVNINPKDLDPTFVKFEDTPFWSGFSAFGLTELGHVLIPYRTSINGLAENNPSFLLISLRKEGNNVVINETKIIKPNIISYYDSVNIIYAAGNLFYVKMGANLVKINSQGDVKVEANIDGIKFAKLDNRVVGIGYSNATKETSIFEAGLDGSNFRVIRKFASDENLSQYNFTGINNRVIAYFDDQIFELTDLTSNAKLKELNNSKLENILISSMYLTKNGEVLITTQCRTLCGGIYSKPLDKFFDYQID